MKRPLVEQKFGVERWMGGHYLGMKRQQSADTGLETTWVDDICQDLIFQKIHISTRRELLNIIGYLNHIIYEQLELTKLHQRKFFKL